MKTITALFLFIFIVTANAQYFYPEDLVRVARGSTGVYGGVVNGQHFGGSYHTPDNGPTVFHRYGDQDGGNRQKPGVHNRFSDDRPSGGGGSFAGASTGSFGGSGGNYGGGAPPAYYPFQGPDAHPFRSPSEFYDFLQSFFSTFNNNLASAFQANQEIQRNAFSAATQAFRDASQQRFGGAPNINFNRGGGGGGGSYAGGGAFSGASVGSGGSHQSAGVYSDNQGSRPGVHSRFGGDDSRGGKPGVVGISSSAFSSSSDVNGKKSTRKQASTTINENGKITTYTVDD